MTSTNKYPIFKSVPIIHISQALASTISAVDFDDIADIYQTDYIDQSPNKHAQGNDKRAPFTLWIACC
jgi:hypothetical protein